MGGILYNSCVSKPPQASAVLCLQVGTTPETLDKSNSSDSLQNPGLGGPDKARRRHLLTALPDTRIQTYSSDSPTIQRTLLFDGPMVRHTLLSIAPSTVKAPVHLSSSP